MRYRLRTLLIVLALAPPLLAVIWAFQDDTASHRIPELVLIVGALLIFLLILYPLLVAAAWTVDSTVAWIAYRHKRR